jgi:hypothetical protein
MISAPPDLVRDAFQVECAANWAVSIDPKRIGQNGVGIGL